MRKEKYLKRIAALVREEGLDLSMETIANRIGVTKKTLYNQFASKENLIDECISYINNGLKIAIASFSDESFPASENFRRGISGIQSEMFDMSHVYLRDLQRIYPDKATRDHMTGSQLLRDGVQKNIELGMASGEYRRDINPTLFARYIIYAIFSFFMRNVMRSDEWPSEDYFRTVTEYHIRALLRNDDNNPASDDKKDMSLIG